MKTNDTAATPGQSPAVSPSLFQSVQAHARPRYSQPLPLSRRAARLSRFVFPSLSFSR